jgi:type I site-specific restriction-modification system R (restriction) subunit
MENYAQIVEEINPKTGKRRQVQVFPRYHQLDGVRRLLAAVTAHGVGERYLVQHSAGSGKSNSIAWLAHQLIGILRDGAALFDSIIVITDRRLLDRQIRETIKGFAQVGSNDIAERIQEDPYRFLVCADNFQTGYDEPLLHTMYVDKPLSGIKAVQTRSRLNRAHPKKHDCFVLDFQNDTDTIEQSFADYYRTTILSKETDPDRLHTLKADLDNYQVYSPQHIDSLVDLYLSGADRDRLDPILDACQDQNAKQHSDRQNARIEHDRALTRVITALFTDDAQLFKQFQDNQSFRHWLTDTMFAMIYEPRKGSLAADERK